MPREVLFVYRPPYAASFDDYFELRFADFQIFAAFRRHFMIFDAAFALSLSFRHF
jgi:hypothetical protein